ncbi:hypothetical protein H0H92_008911 [Tricholoma furcatifolium]|nr:hypothetical protein H0H92_008911 [Tricholoma furcatifolium]
MRAAAGRLREPPNIKSPLYYKSLMNWHNHRSVLMDAETTNCSFPSSLFALIIGIDNYRDPCLSNLRGAVNDANAVQEFLLEFGVNRDRIVLLCNEEATQAAILHAVHHIGYNDTISRTDPILIYYAGHGGAVRPSSNHLAADFPIMKGPLLLPHDFGRKDSSDDDIDTVISNTTLSEILAEVAKRKSDNIVSDPF